MPHLVEYLVMFSCTILGVFEIFYHKNVEIPELFQVSDPAAMWSTGFLVSCASA